MLSAGFRPFFLLAGLWARLAIPIWIAFFAGLGQAQTAFTPIVWHVHEMTFGFGAAAVAGFLLTAIPNWTGRMPLQGGPLALLVLLWIIGRLCATLQDRVTGATTDLEATIERNPLAAVLLGLVAGILVGVLSRGRK